MITLEEVQAVIGRHKIIVSDMTWRSKLSRIEADWFEARLAVQFSDEMEVAEQLFVVCQWRKQQKAIPEQWTFSLFYREARICAIDVQPTAQHMNNVGQGRPLYKQLIDGVHEHTWSDEGYGYAEPIDLLQTEPHIMWRVFLKKAGIGDSDFFHPDHNQPELDLR